MKRLDKKIVAFILISGLLSSISYAQKVNVAVADENDEITLAISEGYNAYALIGFSSFPFVLDISYKHTPVLLAGYEVLESEKVPGLGAYFSYAGEAIVYAIGLDSVPEITSILK